ncbi:MAG: response regulator [bacterium]|nr:response regulator [bacterium]
MEKKLYPEYPVLAVDDETDFLNSLNFTFRSNGINNILRCKDSREVLPLLDKNIFSLIILDLVMPYHSGIDFLAKITKNFPHIPVIVLTATQNNDTAEICIKNGAAAYLSKPIAIPELIKVVKKFSRRSTKKRGMKSQEIFNSKRVWEHFPF